MKIIYLCNQCTFVQQERFAYITYGNLEIIIRAEIRNSVKERGRLFKCDIWRRITAKKNEHFHFCPVHKFICVAHCATQKRPLGRCYLSRSVSRRLSRPYESEFQFACRMSAAEKTATDVWRTSVAFYDYHHTIKGPRDAWWRRAVVSMFYFEEKTGVARNKRKTYLITRSRCSGNSSRPSFVESRFLLARTSLRRTVIYFVNEVTVSVQFCVWCGAHVFEVVDLTPLHVLTIFVDAASTAQWNVVSLSTYCNLWNSYSVVGWFLKPPAI